jgi:two-component system NtrC family sensor kinase
MNAYLTSGSAAIDPAAIDTDPAPFLLAALNASSIAALVFDSDQRVLYANPAARLFARILNPHADQHALTHVSDWHPDLLPAERLDAARRTAEVALDVAGEKRFLLVEISAIGPNYSSPYALSLRDVTRDHTREAELQARNAELEVAYAKLKGAQEQIVQSEKLASIGQLAAGVAHEINNPIGYVSSNLSTLQRYVATLLNAIQQQAAVVSRTGDATATAAAAEISRRFDLDFLATDIPQLLVESLEGIDRVRKIVRDLKDFSRRERSEDWVEVDLHRGIEATLNIIWNELKYKAEIIRSFGELPPVECLPSELNQVFMNVLMNAGQAIKEHGVITVSTGCSEDKVWVAIGDDGEGIPEDVLPRIFDPFFTTKPVGTGTGLGLAISYGIIVKHHGKIEITSVPGQGTLMRIELPIHQPH